MREPADAPPARPPSLNPWLGDRRGYLTDWFTQVWVRATGRTIAWADAEWLTGPAGPSHGIGIEFLDRLAQQEGLELRRQVPGAGLLPNIEVLRGPECDPATLNERVADFYTRTSEYVLDVWSQWSGVFQPFGNLIARIFSRRLQQLNLPMSPLDSSRGMDSDIVHLVDPETGTCTYTCWVRHMLATQRVAYVGTYTTSTPPGGRGPCVKVVFPLPNGSATVLLQPSVTANGGLRLVSGGRRFGDPGFYFVVTKDPDHAWVRYLRSFRETLDVYVDAQGDLRTDHTFTLWGLVFLRLHYRLTHEPTQDR